jgi:hypothetical protein
VKTDTNWVKPGATSFLLPTFPTARTSPLASAQVSTSHTPFLRPIHTTAFLPVHDIHPEDGTEVFAETSEEAQRKTRVKPETRCDARETLVLTSTGSSQRRPPNTQSINLRGTPYLGVFLGLKRS